MAGVSEGVELTERQKYWLGHVQECRKSGGGMKSYAETHGLEVREFYHWKRWLGGKGLLEEGWKRIRLFQRVVVEPENEHAPSPVCRVTFPNGVRIELAGPLNASLLGAVFKAAGGLT